MLVKVGSCSCHQGRVLTVRQNIVRGVLVNGSVGLVTGFMTGDDAEKAQIEIALSELKEVENRDGGPPRIAEQVLRSRRLWPLVAFQNGQTRLCVPEPFDVHDHEGKIRGTRHQV